MKRLSMLLGTSTALGLAALVVSFASCATTEEGVTEAPEGSTLPGIDGATDGAAPADAGIDGSCEPTDPSCVTETITCDQADWCPSAAPVSNSVALMAVWGSGPSDVWAVGSAGAVIRWDGTKWTSMPTNRKETLRAVWGTGPSEIIAAASTAVILRSGGASSGPATWTPLPNVTNDRETGAVFTMWGAGAGDVRIGTRSFYVTAPNGDSNLANIASKTTVDGGVGWATTLGSATVLGMWGASGDDLWVVGDNSFYVPYQRGYTAHGVRANATKPYTWTEIDSQSAVALEGVWGSSANDLWAVGSVGTIRHASAASTQWDIVASPTRSTLHRVWGSGPNDVWAVGDDATILHYDGKTWTASVVSLPVGKKRPALYGLWGNAKDDVWAVGDAIVLRLTGKKTGGGK